MNTRRFSLFALVKVTALLFAVNSQAATVTAFVDRNTLEDGDTVQLTLEVEGQNNARPDIAPLHKDFEVLGTSNMTRMSITNGRASSSTQWIVNLRPRRVGALTVPALQVGAERSQPITIHVGKAQGQDQGQSGTGVKADLFVESEVSSQSPYLQAQLTYTVRLFHAFDLQSGQLSEPRNADVLIHRIGEDRRYMATRHGRRYKVIERRYALFAQKSGPLSIEAPVFEGQVIDPRGQGQSPFGQLFGRDPFNGMLGATRPVRVRGEAQQILVKPRPAAAQGPYWVPAQALELSGEWQPAQSAVKVGEPLTLTLKMNVSGLTAAQLPEVMPDAVQGFSVYPDRAETQTVFDDEGNARGTRTQKIAFIAREAGDLHIPDLVVRWWNTTSDQEEIARLPGLTLSVAPDPSSSVTSVPAQTAASAISTPPEVRANMPPSPEPQLSSTQDGAAWLDARLWMGLSALLVLVWLTTLVLWRRDRRASPAVPPGGMTDTDVVRTLNDKKARANILEACERSDASATRNALLAWGAAQWPDSAPRGLEQLARRIDDDALGQALRALDRALYAGDGQWSGEPLKALLPRLKSAKPPAPKRRTSALPLHYAQAE